MYYLKQTLQTLVEILALLNLQIQFIECFFALRLSSTTTTSAKNNNKTLIYGTVSNLALLRDVSLFTHELWWNHIRDQRIMMRGKHLLNIMHKQFRKFLRILKTNMKLLFLLQRNWLPCNRRKRHMLIFWHFEFKLIASNFLRLQKAQKYSKNMFSF